MKNGRLRIVGVLLSALLMRVSGGMTPEDRESYRHMMVINLPEVPAFTEWLQKSNELPPDFDSLPRHNGLPEPLAFMDGKPVRTAAEWRVRREEILKLYQQYVWGTIPPRLKFERAEMQESTDAAGRVVRTGVLRVGPEGSGGSGRLRVTMTIPPGKGPFPVVMSPGMVQAATLTGHGYIAVSYAGRDGSDDSAGLAALVPGADVGTLPRRAWVASVVMDYLLTVPEVDGKQVAITGYSRDGKTAIIAAALDERIAGVLAGSPGVGGILPFRLAGELNQAESIQSTTMMFPDWFHPRLRYFSGREDRLPVDGNLLLAAIAPRPFFMVAGLNDEVSNDWGDEQSFHSAEKVYGLLGTSGRLGIHRVPGYHGANDWEAAVGFLDGQFGRSDKKWVNQWMFPWDFEGWKKSSGETVDLAKYPDRRNADVLNGGAIKTTAAWEVKAAEVRKNMMWMMGDQTIAGGKTLPVAPVAADVAGWVIRRSVGAQAIPEFGWYAQYNSNTATRVVSINEQVKGTLYYPADAPAGKKLPTVIWLHGASYPLGYMWVYRRDVHPILALVEAGFAVLAYDQSGFGSRMWESSEAYQSMFPHGSQMGRMVADARAAVDVLAKDPAVDAGHISLFGYAMGGNVALYAAALEPRVNGVVAVCGFTPMRTDVVGKGTGGVARYAVERGLLPRLGFFIGNEGKIPYDYDEVLGAIAPRPVYLVNPVYDREATPGDVRSAVTAARKVYGLYRAEDKLKLNEPFDYNRLPSYTQDRAILWMTQQLK